MKAQPILYVLLTALLLIFSTLTLIYGETPWDVVWKEALEKINGTSPHWNPLLDERIPRLIVIICTGASLAVSGAVMQSLFQNPLASPSVLGISCGGSLLVILVFVFELQSAYPYSVPIAAFGGSLLTLLIVYSLSRDREGIKLNHLILTGIALSTLLITIQGALLYALRDRWQLIQTLTEWQAGSTYDRNWSHVNMQLPLTIFGLAGCWYYSREVNILTLGEEEAINLGVEVPKVRWRLFLCVSMLTGGAIAAVGIIAFFGLILPHIIRYLCGPDNRQIIPLCIIGGSSTMAAIDFFIRFYSIHAFSIGNVSAILGGIFFLVLLLSMRRNQICTT